MQWQQNFGILTRLAQSPFTTLSTCVLANWRMTLIFSSITNDSCKH